MNHTLLKRLGAQARSPWPHAAGCLALLLISSAPAQAAPAQANARSVYARAQARCMAMPVHGDRANCLSEASTAHEATLPAEIDPDPGRYARNAQVRCQPLPVDDRQDCLARMAGQGTTTGSVAGGGIYRELITRETAPQAAPAAPASAGPAASAAPR